MDEKSLGGFGMRVAALSSRCLFGFLFHIKACFSANAVKSI
ncbi:MAG: hypothetical protein ACUVQY_01605 [Thermoproteota archaeon]